MSWINIMPAACAHVEKNPLRMRAPMNESKVVAAAHQIAVAKATMRK